MLSVDYCKKRLAGLNYTDQQIEEIRNSLYQLADILICQYTLNKKPANQNTT